MQERALKIRILDNLNPKKFTIITSLDSRPIKFSYFMVFEDLFGFVGREPKGRADNYTKRSCYFKI